VKGLTGLARIELDREVRREQVVWRQQRIQDRQDPGVLHQLRDHGRLAQERIDALGLEALEVVPAAKRPAEVGRERRLDAVDLAIPARLVPPVTRRTVTRLRRGAGNRPNSLAKRLALGAHSRNDPDLIVRLLADRGAVDDGRFPEVIPLACPKQEGSRVHVDP
jgi:hypothetical protein